MTLHVTLENEPLLVVATPTVPGSTTCQILACLFHKYQFVVMVSGAPFAWSQGIILV